MKKLISKMSLIALAVMLTSIFAIGITSCQDCKVKENSSTVTSELNVSITEQEVATSQNSWGEGIVKIGKVYSEKGDYKTEAINHINNFYNYQEGSVLFKPTLTHEKQFRTDFQGALSYFIGGDANYPEDHGFAIKPWSNVRWENVGIKIVDNVALAMGNYYFTPAKGGDDVKVEYSFAYTRDKEGKLKIILHDSHLPYNPSEKH